MGMEKDMNEKNFEQRKKMICDLLASDLYVPMKEKELAVVLQVAKSDREELKKVLESLLAEHKIQISKRGKYSLCDESELIGIFISNSKGFGFVEVEGQKEDYYVPEAYINGAFHRDKVRIELLPAKSGKRQEVKIVEILEHGMTQVVGTYQKSQNFGFVLPDNGKLSSDIFIPKEKSKGAVDGHKVVVELTDYGDERRSPEGKVIEILGHINDPGVDIMSIVRGYELPVEFSEKIMHQVERVSQEVSEADMAGRTDLRSTVMVTIDGEDAKDLDDAVSLTKKDGLYYLGVHIADVANYVQENSALDREAKLRGTSVYLVDRVIPMLPHALSNGICSLNAGVDRLALSCLMTINEKGQVIDHDIVESVIHVTKRMSYTQVRQILEDKDEEVIAEHKDLVPMFELMEELAGILRRKRKQRGSIDFDFPESKIILDRDGRPIEIKPYERNVATNIIEDFMLAANETVSQHCFWMEVPFLYRTHDMPDAEKLEKLMLFIHNFGYHLKLGSGAIGEQIHPKEIQKLLAKIEGTKEEALISRLTLRSMKQAKYTVEASGHFGLACDYYSHFTSPIRRYPDLQIHRIIKEQIRGRLKENRIAHYAEILPEVAKHSSEMERRADEAERETEKLKKAQYMEERIGQCFEGVISGITAWGIYVELPNTIEGMIHVSKLSGDYYYYDEAKYEMVGEETGRCFKLGERLKIKVVGVDRMSRSIDFVLAEEEEKDWKQYLD